MTLSLWLPGAAGALQDETAWKAGESENLPSLCYNSLVFVPLPLWSSHRTPGPRAQDNREQMNELLARFQFLYLHTETRAFETRVSVSPSWSLGFSHCKTGVACCCPVLIFVIPAIATF